MEVVKLSNGITLGLRKTRSPIADIHVGIRVGSQYEKDGERGIAHVVEHMLFKGTKTLNSEQLIEEISLLGGGTNAYTNLKETVYYLNLPAYNIKKGLQLLIDAFFYPPFRSNDFDAEKKVVLEELKSGEDDFDNVHYDGILLSTFGKSYNKVIGLESVIEKMSVNDIRKFYKRTYVADNIFIVVSGDINCSWVRKELEKINLPTKSKTTNKELIFHPTEYMIKKKVRQMKVGLAYKALGHDNFKDYLAQEILISYLGRGMDSLLFKEVRERNSLCYSISIWALIHAKIGMAAVISQIDPLSKTKFDDIISKIFSNPLPISKIDLLRVKTQIKSSLLIRSETSYGFNSFWLSGLIDGEENLMGLYMTTIDKIKLKDVEDVYERVFRIPFINKNFGISILQSK